MFTVLDTLRSIMTCSGVLVSIHYMARRAVYPQLTDAAALRLVIGFVQAPLNPRMLARWRQKLQREFIQAPSGYEGVWGGTWKLSTQDVGSCTARRPPC